MGILKCTAMPRRVDNTDDRHVLDILQENEKRISDFNSSFNPVTGEGCGDRRFRLHLPDFPIPDQDLPVEMKKIPLVRQLMEAGSVEAYLDALYEECDRESAEPVQRNYGFDKEQIVEQFTRLRMKHDPFFFFAVFIYIKPKGGGLPFRFVLRRPQRRLLRWLEERRKKNRPIRLILLKARQWGGSTVIQMYMLWLQIMWKKGLNSLIVAQVKDTAETIRGMFYEALKAFPAKFLHEMGEAYSDDEPKFVGFGTSGNVKKVPQRFCKIKVGSMQKPTSANGEDYNLVHCSEVGLWEKTEGKSPEDVVQNATNGILYRPYTMIVYESTANGTGNFFHREWVSAKKGQSQFEPFFVPWFEIYDMYHLDFGTKKERMEFAAWLYDHREDNNVMSDREEPGTYLWRLWRMGAPLEAIHWYITERKKFTDHGDMASGYPSDDVEAFKHSGAKVFAEDKVEKFRRQCRAPKVVGDVYGDGYKGSRCLQHVRFCEDRQGQLWIWNFPEVFDDCKVTDRYLVVVDIGGRGAKADWSVICVFDRYWMMEGGKPYVVAQWYGHVDMDLLAWKAAQIAKFYDNALLVIESNTLETKDREHILEGGDQSEFILNQIKDCYDNLYARKQSEADIREGLPRKYGFHTNVATKPMIISTLVQVVREHLYVERDERCLDEFVTYERKKNGAYGAIDGKHDDLLMTRAIGLHICFNEMDMPKMVYNKARMMKRRVSVSAATIT